MGNAVSSVATAVMVTSVAGIAYAWFQDVRHLIPYLGSAAGGAAFAVFAGGIDTIFALSGGVALAFFLFPGLQFVYGWGDQGNRQATAVQAIKSMRGTSMIFFGGMAAGVTHAASKNMTASALAGGLGVLFGQRLGWIATSNFWISLGFSGQQLCGDPSSHPDYSQCVVTCNYVGKKGRDELYKKCMGEYGAGAGAWCQNTYVPYMAMCPKTDEHKWVPYNASAPSGPPADGLCKQYAPYDTLGLSYASMCTPVAYPAGNPNWTAASTTSPDGKDTAQGWLGFVARGGKINYGGVPAKPENMGAESGRQGYPTPAPSAPWRMVAPGIATGIPNAKSKYTCVSAAPYSAGQNNYWYQLYDPVNQPTPSQLNYNAWPSKALPGHYPSGQSCVPTQTINGKFTPRWDLDTQPTAVDAPKFCGIGKAKAPYKTQHVVGMGSQGFTCAKYPGESTSDMPPVKPWPV